MVRLVAEKKSLEFTINICECSDWFIKASPMCSMAADIDGMVVSLNTVDYEERCDEFFILHANKNMPVSIFIIMISS